MNKSLSLAAMLLVSTVLLAPDMAGAAGAGVPSTGGGTYERAPPNSPKGSHAKKKTRNGKSSSLEEFIIGYEAAYALI